MFRGCPQRGDARTDGREVIAGNLGHWVVVGSEIRATKKSHRYVWYSHGDPLYSGTDAIYWCCGWICGCGCGCGCKGCVLLLLGAGA